MTLSESQPEPPPFYPKASTSEERDEIVQVVEALYIGNWRGAADRTALRDRRVTHVLSVGSEFVADKIDDGLVHFTKDIGDDADQETAEDMARSLNEMCEWIECAIGSKGRVLVHCAAGASRSPTVVLAYLVAKRGTSFATLHDAFAHLHAVRRCAWPNDGFMGALIALEVALKGKASISMEDYECWGEWDTADEWQDHDATRLAGLDTAKWGGADAKGARWGLAAGLGTARRLSGPKAR